MSRASRVPASVIASTTLLLGFSTATAQPRVAIQSIEPTVLFPNGPELRQLALLKVDNPGAPCHDCRVQVAIANGPAETQSLDLISGLSSNRLLIPDLQTH